MFSLPSQVHPRLPVAAMRRFCLPAALLLASFLWGQHAFSQSCTNLCQQQISNTVCAAGTTTSISGIVYAPNGVDPLPNVLVYIPNDPVPLPAFPPGVECTPAGQVPSGSPLIGTTSAVDGSFTLANVPVGANIPLVIQSGRWRRQVILPGVTQCTDNPVDKALTHMPTTQAEGDIPKIAIATGAVDALECVLRKIGISDTEFTNPADGGRIHLYLGTSKPGSSINGVTPSESVLVSSADTLKQYDMVMFSCQGNARNQATVETQGNLIEFANAGGKVFGSHYSYIWLSIGAPFSGTANWGPGSSTTLLAGPATVDTSFPGGELLAEWLDKTGASTSFGQINLKTPTHDQTGVIAPTQSWLTLNDSANGNPVMQLTFNTPIGAPAASQCGRVLYDDYHVESVDDAGSLTFPNECAGSSMTAQEKLLEYSLFDLTNNGSAPTLTPTSQDFGPSTLGTTSASQTFTFTNPSVFPVTVTSVAASGDFTSTSNTCATEIPTNGTCQITATFAPAAVGARTGTLTVGFSGTTLHSSLTGTGTPALIFAPSPLDFGSVGVGTPSAIKSISLTNVSALPVPLALPTTTGNFSVASNSCPGSLAPTTSCTIGLTFTPAALGARTGTVTLASSNPAYGSAIGDLTGTGITDLQSTATTVDFGNIDVGATSPSIDISLTNITSASIPMAAPTATGDFTVAGNTCTGAIAPGARCIVSVTFTPSATGPRTGVLTVPSANPAYTGPTLNLTGNGVDFIISITPASGQVMAGHSITTSVSVSPVAGFASPVRLSCTTDAPGSTCGIGSITFIPSSTTTSNVTITTTYEYTVPGYGGMGGPLSLLGIACGVLLWIKRRNNSTITRYGLFALLLVALGLGTTGCSGKLPDKNNPYTAPGEYTYTLTATDGVLTHSATYKLTVTK